MPLPSDNSSMFVATMGSTKSHIYSFSSDYGAIAIENHNELVIDAFCIFWYYPRLLLWDGSVVDGLHAARSRHILDLHGDFTNKVVVKHDPLPTLFLFPPMEDAQLMPPLMTLIFSPIIPHPLTYHHPHIIISYGYACTLYIFTIFLAYYVICGIYEFGNYVIC